MYKLCFGQAQYMYLTILTFIWPLWPWPSTYLKNVLTGTSPLQGQQLCQIGLKSMHYCTRYGPDKFGRTHGRTQIHRTKIVTNMSRLPANGLGKHQFTLPVIFPHMVKCLVYNSVVLAEMGLPAFLRVIISDTVHWSLSWSPDPVTDPC